MADADREQLIRARAHRIWESEGHIEGGQDRHWLQAEREVDAEAAAPAEPPAPKRARKAASGKAQAKGEAGGSAPPKSKPTARSAAGKVGPAVDGLAAR